MNPAAAPAGQFAQLPDQVRARYLAEARAAYHVEEFWDLDPGVRRAVYERAVDDYVRRRP